MSRESTARQLPGLCTLNLTHELRRCLNGARQKATTCVWTTHHCHPFSYGIIIRGIPPRAPKSIRPSILAGWRALTARASSGRTLDVVLRRLQVRYTLSRRANIIASCLPVASCGHSADVDSGDGVLGVYLFICLGHCYFSLQSRGGWLGAFSCITTLFRAGTYLSRVV